MKEFLYLTVALFFIGSFARAQLTPFQQALQYIDNSNIHEAYKILESIPANDKDFVDAITELQKIHYRKQEWQKFFAYAQFYRGKIAVKTNGPIQARLISLEAMALAKHCYWNKADEVIEWGLQDRDRISKEGYEELSETKVYIQLQNKFPNTAKAQENAVRIPIVFSKKQVWKIENKSLLAISHPKFLSVNLKSECVR